MKLKYLFFLPAAFLAVQPFVLEVRSCSVPVFRYALERWRPDPYKGIFIYRDGIPETDRALLEQLKRLASNPDYPLNLVIREVDVDAFTEEKLAELLKGPLPGTLPALAIWYPGQMGEKAPVWVEKPAPSFLEALAQSPKRIEMAERLINGDSVVWVFIPSGNTRKDERAEALIRAELDVALKAYSRMPFSILSGGRRKQLTYGFPVLTVSREDPAERAFVDMLMKSEPDLYEHTGEPMVFPVFGRGRSLGCLFGAYITEENIRNAAAFLSGSCSCEVKELNPGVDLLVAAPWDMVVMHSFVDDTPLPELTGVMPAAAVIEEPAPAAAAPAAAAPLPEPLAAETGGARNRGILKAYGITLGAILAVVVFAGIFINRRRNKNS
ncbi:MAG: hypothetical protein JW793_03515 [Acidobacteria bacterium]|nr:hypothetical protein [Acidobacteriota bacterium]